MKALSIILIAVFGASARAELSYGLRETTIAHPSLGFKTKENVLHVMVKSGVVATRQYDIVQVVESEGNLITLIDYRTKTFATASLDEIDNKGFDSIQEGIGSELIVSVFAPFCRVLKKGGSSTLVKRCEGPNARLRSGGSTPDCVSTIMTP
jgi:hypothetical protein